MAGTPEQIIHAYAVEIRQGAQNARRNHPLAAFIIGIGALGDIDCRADFFLREMRIFTQFADPFLSFHYDHRYQKF